MSDGLDVGGLLGTVVVAGVATNMVKSMFPKDKDDNGNGHSRRKKKREVEENGYTRNNAIFGNNKYRPF